MILAAVNLLQIVALLRQMHIHWLRVREVIQVQDDLGLLIHNLIQHPLQLCFRNTQAVAGGIFIYLGMSAVLSRTVSMWEVSIWEKT